MMQWFANRKLATRLLTAFAMVLLAMAALGVYALDALGHVNASAVDLETNWMPSVRYLAEINTEKSDFRIAQLLHVATDEKPRYEREMERLLGEIARNEVAYVPLIASDEERRHYEAFKRAWDAYVDQNEALVALSRAQKKDEARAILRASEKPFELVSNELVADIDVNVKGARAAAQHGADVFADARRWAVGLFVAAIFLGVALALLLARSISLPARRLAATAERIALGEVDAAIDDSAADELGDIARSFRKLQGTLASLVAETNTLTKTAREGQLDVRGAPDVFHGAFRDLVIGVNELLEVIVQPPLEAIGRISPLLAASSQELGGVSQKLASTATQTSGRGNVVAVAAEQASRIVETLSAASDEMIASIKEISRNATQAAHVATSAKQAADATNVTMGRLATSTADIGKVLKVISSIAQQTNLLALNATIEAARAGDAGKGFAVVASEVKDLAKETARATEDIAQRIASIQADSREAALALEQINGVVVEIDATQASVATAVEEQTATTNEMARSLREAASAVAEIARNIRAVADNAAAVANGSSDVQQTATRLAKLSDDLADVVAMFKVAPGHDGMRARAPASLRRLTSQRRT